ncbi:MAG: glycosyl hydrolase family 28 protein [Planctomycetota bacterium]|jgi:hypothetical protein|nr:glycosyl hydrolase family 28 protein [Planctomycetota bacterium]
MTEPQLNLIPHDLRADEFRTSMRGDATACWLPGHAMRVDSMHEHPHANGGSEATVLGSADGAWSVRIALPETISDVELLPPGRGSVHYADNEVIVSAEQAGYLVLNCNHADPERPHRTAYILIDQTDPAAPRVDDPAVKSLSPGTHQASELLPDQRRTVVLLPGVHDIEGQMVNLCGDMRLHLCPGAHLRSYVCADSVHGLAITGTGVIDGTGVTCRGREWRDDGWDGFVLFRRCIDCRFDGPVILNSPFWNLVTFATRGMRISRYKALTWLVNNDGVQPRSCQDLIVEDSFLKCADDCIAVKTRRDAGMHSHDLLFRRLTCWNDRPGNPLEIGHTSQADVLERVRFEDIDIVHAHTGNCLSIALIDGSEVREVNYHNIRQSGFCTAGAVGFRIETSRYTTDAHRGKLHDISIDGFHLKGDKPGGRIIGYDADAHRIHAIRCNNLTLNEQATSLDQLGVEQVNCDDVVG